MRNSPMMGVDRRSSKKTFGAVPLESASGEPGAFEAYVQAALEMETANVRVDHRLRRSSEEAATWCLGDDRVSHTDRRKQTMPRFQRIV